MALVSDMNPILVPQGKSVSSKVILRVRLSIGVQGRVRVQSEANQIDFGQLEASQTSRRSENPELTIQSYP